MREPALGETGLIVLPPPEIRNEINMWRRVYNAYDSIVSPHITVVYPFITLGLWDASRMTIINAIRDVHCFDVKLRELGTFMHNEAVLWLKPENGRNITRIRRKVHVLFAQHRASSLLSYVPHLTIGFFETVENMLRARGNILKQMRPLQFTVDKIVYAVFEQGGWNIHDYVKLT